MSLVRVLAQRIALGIAAAWAVLSVVFLLFTQTRDWQLGQMIARAARGRATKEEIQEIRQEYLAERGMDRPLHEQYVDWMGNMFTLQWGESFETGAAVFPTTVEATVQTASYVVPGLVLATVVGVVVGLYAALNDRSIGDRSLRSATYLAFGLPNFWLAVMGSVVFGAVRLGHTPRSTAIRPSELPFFYEYVLPTLLVASTLLAGMVSYSRAYSLQYVSDDLAKLVRAKGGDRFAVAWHVLRNAAIPLVSLAFAETLALLALSVFVMEAVFGIDGLGLLFYNAVWARDLPVLMGGTMVIVAVGVAGNVVQDLAYSALDPRVDTGAR